MKQRIICMALILSLLVGGCSWGSSYVSVTPHHEQKTGGQTGSLTASAYNQLRDLLAELTEAGTESAVINVSKYDQSKVEEDMKRTVRYITEVLPIGAYAVDKVDYEIGVSGGQPAISVSISYLHGRSELRQIKQAGNVEAAKIIINKALADCDDGVVVYVEKYTEIDPIQLVADYAAENPSVVMEIPQVAVGFYPETGTTRVLELKFTYQTSRDVLRSMQSQVRRVYTSASLYVDQNDADEQKYNQLRTFLTERFDYKFETSITPSYSLLCHGVGDGRTFALVYAAMCRNAGLDCRMVSGTRNGEAWYWNMIREDGVYYHVDLLANWDMERLLRLTDDQMTGYVWDYSAYPQTGAVA